jgi:microcystin-dependent protein
MAWYNWSRTASANATADSTINWAEGQAPSSVNDSSRAMMARTAEYRDDIAGAIVTGGTSTAYTVTSFQVFDTLAHLNGQMIAFTPHTTNGVTVTLNVDGLGAKPLRTSPSTELLAGVIIQGTPYTATYNNVDGAFYLQGFFGNPYNIPLGAGIEFWSGVTPNSSFVQPFGQAINRTTYAALFGIMGTTYGVGDGSTTFNLPDLRGRVRAALDNMGGVTSGRLAAVIVGTTLGAAGGGDTQTLTLAQLPGGITSSGVNTIIVFPQGTSSGITYADTTGTISDGAITLGGGASHVPVSTGSWSGTNSISGGNTINVTSNNTGATSHPILQPTIVCNYIMRII